MTWRAAVTLAVFSLTCLLTGPVGATSFGGIEFPEGEVSFADEVIRFDPLFSGGPGPTDPNHIDPQSALGIPDFGINSVHSVSLGSGGLLELAFLDNLLTNSGDSMFDLHVFEIGADVEDTFVAIRPTASTLLLLDPMGDLDGDGFFEVGGVFGSTSSIDIDIFFAGFAPGELTFDAVQLIDDFNEGNATGATVGADIDAVGAIAAIAVPEPNCAATPAPGCFAMQKASLAIQEKKPGNEKLKIKLKKPEQPLPDGALGDPLTTTTTSACLYDGAETLVGELSVDPGGVCGTKAKPCWKAPGSGGFGYKDKEASSSGVLKFKAKEKGTLQLTARNNEKKGQSAMPTGIAAALEGATSARMQVVTSDAECFDAMLGTVKKADGIQFKAKTP